MQRTKLQNKSLHKYFTLLAEALDDAGLDMRAVLKPEIEIPWTGDSIKEQMARPIIKAMFNFDSTTELDTKQIQEFYKVLDRHTSEKLGVHIEWPSDEAPMTMIE